MTPTITLKVLLMFDPNGVDNDKFMQEKMHELRIKMMDAFPLLSDTQVRKFTRISNDVCACTFHLSNYPTARLTHFLHSLTQTQDLSMLRVLEFSFIEVNTK